LEGPGIRRGTCITRRSPSCDEGLSSMAWKVGITTSAAPIFTGLRWGEPPRSMLSKEVAERPACRQPAFQTTRDHDRESMHTVIIAQAIFFLTIRNLPTRASHPQYPGKPTHSDWWMGFYNQNQAPIHCDWLLARDRVSSLREGLGRR
jgi:hypothetical protein